MASTVPALCVRYGDETLFLFRVHSIRILYSGSDFEMVPLLQIFLLPLKLLLMLPQIQISSGRQAPCVPVMVGSLAHEDTV